MSIPVLVAVCCSPVAVVFGDAESPVFRSGGAEAFEVPLTCEGRTQSVAIKLLIHRSRSAQRILDGIGAVLRKLPPSEVIRF